MRGTFPAARQGERLPKEISLTADVIACVGSNYYTAPNQRSIALPPSAGILRNDNHAGAL